MQEVVRHRRKNFGKLALPVSAVLLAVIGALLSTIIFFEEGWNWHVPMPVLFFGSLGAMLHWFYGKGNEIIEIAPDRISVIAGNHTVKTLAYSEISALKYTYVEQYKPPTIELKGPNCTIAFDGEMEDYPSTVKALFHHLKQNGRDDLMETYTRQFKKLHGVHF